ncbi:MAG: universal stress protein [Desulfovibrionaceae bacterium]|nr:universal stress protein [Desulfovibrionaceae bacterium]
MNISKILCAVDLAEDCSLIAKYANKMAKDMGSEVLVLYAAPTLKQYVGFHVQPDTIGHFVDEITTAAQEKMDSFVASNFTDVKAEGRVVVGYASEEILRASVREQCDLIIMSTHGRTGLDRILFGSVAEKVVQKSSIPVLSLRPEDLERIEREEQSA